jgi:hypothetical protein
VRKTLNQVDPKLINARFFGIVPGMFGLVQGWIDASVAEKLGPQLGTRHPYFALHPFFPFLSDAWTTVSVSRKTKNGAFRYDVSMAFVRSVT